MPHAVKFYRTGAMSRWLKQRGIDKPQGWTLGQARYNDRLKASKDAKHLRDIGIRVEVVSAQHEANLR